MARSDELKERRPLSSLVSNVSFSDPLFAQLWSGQPPGWARRCDAGAGPDDSAGLSGGDWPPPRNRERRGCGSVWCPYCASTRISTRTDGLARRLRSVRVAGQGLGTLTLTVRSFPLGQLVLQLTALHEAWAGAKEGSPYARIAARHGANGYMWGLHPAFSSGQWHAHLHIVIAALDDRAAQMAGVELGDRFKTRLGRSGLPVTSRTVEVGPADGRPKAIAGYLCDFWKVGKPGGLHALFLAALRGEGVAKEALSELMHTLHRRSLVRGSGVLGRGGAT